MYLLMKGLYMIPTLHDIFDVANNMLFTMLLLSLPTLLTALFVGVGISLVQTVTGVQEMTLTFVPKLIMVVVVIAMTLSWSSTVMMEYTQNLLALFSANY